MARPRQPEIDRLLVEAWIALSEERAYAEITMAAVAERAGVGKPALYRRYRSKAHLAFASGVVRSIPTDLVDHGSLEADLLDALRALVASLEAIPRDVYADQIGAAIADADFGRTVQQAYAAPALDAVMVVWDRAVARGEVDPALDGRAALDDIAGSVIFETMVRHRRADEAYLGQLVRRFVRGVGRS